MARPRVRSTHPNINYPMETPSWSVPDLYRNLSAREAAPDMATAFVITVNHWAGKYDSLAVASAIIYGEWKKPLQSELWVRFINAKNKKTVF